VIKVVGNNKKYLNVMQSARYLTDVKQIRIFIYIYMFRIQNFTVTCPVRDALMHENRRADIKETEVLFQPCQGA
jgi:hypothetical protein